MNDGVAFEKSKRFAIRIVRLYKLLTDDRREYTMAKQVLRSGTSIGANLAEAKRAISRADFAAKVYIALKECSETEYWLEILHETGYLSDAEYNSIASECEELIRLLTATTRTLAKE